MHHLWNTPDCRVPWSKRFRFLEYDHPIIMKSIFSFPTRVSSFPGLISVARVNEYRTIDVTRVLKGPGVELCQNACGVVNEQRYLICVICSRIVLQSAQWINSERIYIFAVAFTTSKDFFSIFSCNSKILTDWKIWVRIFKPLLTSCYHTFPQTHLF